VVGIACEKRYMYHDYTNMGCIIMGLSISDAVTIIKQVAALPGSSPQLLNRIFQTFGYQDKANSGQADIRRFLQDLDLILVNKTSRQAIAGSVSADDYKKFVKNIPLISNPVFRDVAEFLHNDIKNEMDGGAPPAVAGTTTANVGAFPVALGQESPGRKRKKHESVTRRMGLGSYHLSEIIDADEELKEFE
jgi:hypothetical protein